MLDLLLQNASTIASLKGSHRKLSILIYHRVLPCYDPLRPGEIDAKKFDWQLSILSKHYNVLPLSDAIIRLNENSLPPRAACITFDDGYADNAEIALPLLIKYNLPATFFIATGYLSGGIMWNDIIIESLRNTKKEELDLQPLGLGIYSISDYNSRYISATDIINRIKYQPLAMRSQLADTVATLANAFPPRDLMMTTEQLQKMLKNNMELGGHTINHPILAQLPDTQAEYEIAAGKKNLETLIDQPVSLFAYPNGKPTEDYTASHIDMIQRAGYRAAVTTAWGAANSRTPLFQLPRFTPWDQTKSRFMLRLIKNSVLQKVEAV